MLVVLIHGRQSTPETSGMIRILKPLLEENGFDVIAPTYNTSGSKGEIEKEFIEQIRSAQDEFNEQEIAFIGSSLGGFWARHLANKFPGSKLIMINPSLKFYGQVERYSNEKERSIPTTLFLSKDDDVVPYEIAYDHYKDMADIRLFEHGGHRFSPLSEVKGDIVKALNRYFV